MGRDNVESQGQPGINPRPIPALLDRAAREHGNRPAIDFMGKHTTYAELAQEVARAAAGLAAIGVGPGTRVGLCLPNTPYSVIFFFAILRLGAVVVNFNPLYVEREIAHQIADSGTTVMITADLKAVYPKVQKVAVQAGLAHIVLCPMAAALPMVSRIVYPWAKSSDTAAIQRDGISISYADLLRGGRTLNAPAIDPQSLAVLQYTGGTTGIPKAAELTHANITANCDQVAAGLGLHDHGVERVMGVIPLFHVFALTAVMMMSVAIAAEMILLPRFELKQFLDAVQHKRPTIVPAVPTIFAAIADAARRNPRDLSSIRICISGGAPLPQEVRERFMKVTGAVLTEGYGLSEASPVVAFTPPGRPYKSNSVGMALPGSTLQIRDPGNPARVLQTGERGEVWVRGPQVMRGYWQQPGETAQVLQDGWLRTGDVGYFDEEGYLFLVDRIKDVIIAGGYNIYPRVLEEALYQHPAVREAVVIGVPDRYRGQAPKAFVTLQEGASATPAELREFLGDYVSKIEMPREIELRESLPRTMVGKLSKKELVAEELAKAEG